MAEDGLPRPSMMRALRARTQMMMAGATSQPDQPAAVQGGGPLAVPPGSPAWPAPEAPAIGGGLVARHLRAWRRRAARSRPHHRMALVAAWSRPRRGSPPVPLARRRPHWQRRGKRRWPPPRARRHRGTRRCSGSSVCARSSAGRSWPSSSRRTAARSPTPRTPSCSASSISCCLLKRDDRRRRLLAECPINWPRIKPGHGQPLLNLGDPCCIVPGRVGRIAGELVVEIPRILADFLDVLLALREAFDALPDAIGESTPNPSPSALTNLQQMKASPSSMTARHKIR